MTRIALVEDDAGIRDALAQILSQRGYEPVPVTDFSHTSQTVLDAACDLVLLDLGLPGVDGTVVCREIRSRSDVPIIVVTSRSSEVDEVLSMTMGADDFVTKPYSAHVLAARIEALLRRVKGARSRPVVEHNGLTLDIEASCASANGKTVELTRNELRILAYLMRNAGSVVARAALMCELWDTDAYVDDNTLTVNINRLRQTLARIGVRDYLTTHRGQGYSV